MADFGLSRRLYSSNYYRQLSAVYLPVKWTALESLSHSVYTTQSDVVSPALPPPPPLGATHPLPSDVLPSVLSVVVWRDHVGDHVPGPDPLPWGPERRAAGPAAVWSPAQGPLRL